MNKSVKLLSLFTIYLIGLTLSSSASAGAVENPSKKPNSIALKNLFKEDFKLGTSFNFDHFRDQELLSHINKHFNCLTTENEFKWSSINPKPHIYNFEKNLSNQEYEEKLEIRLEKLELKLEKLNTSILNLKNIDSLNNPKVLKKFENTKD